MFVKYRVTVGSLYREEVKARLQSLNLPFMESDANWFRSEITIIAETTAEQLALKEFKTYCAALAERIAKVGEEEARELWKNQIAAVLEQRNKNEQEPTKHENRSRRHSLPRLRKMLRKLSS